MWRIKIIIWTIQGIKKSGKSINNKGSEEIGEWFLKFGINALSLRNNIYKPYYLGEGSA